MSGRALLRRRQLNKGLKEMKEWVMHQMREEPPSEREQQVRWLRGPGTPEVCRKSEGDWVVGAT